MANRQLTTSIIAQAAVKVLDNELGMANRVYRGYESEYDKRVNGYEVGDTISIRRPTDFTVRDGAVSTAQDVQEGKFSLVVNKQKGVDFKFTSTELTLNISELSERVIKPAMVQLANQIDVDLMAEYANVWNWVGAPGQDVNSFTDFSKAPERLDNGAVPMDERYASLSTTDFWALAGSASALYMQDVARQAYREGMIGDLGGVDTYKSQNVPVLTTGSRDNTTPVVSGTQSTDWATTRDTGTMSLVTTGWDSSATIAAGDVFTISGVFAVNPVTKATLPYLQQFVVKTALTANQTATLTTGIVISPPIIATGAFKNVSAVAAASATITVMGTASTNYTQNLVFHRNAFALAVVPMIKPPGAVDVARESYKGLSVRLIPFYDGTNDASNYRLDVLYGVKTVDARLATRLSGTA